MRGRTAGLVAAWLATAATAGAQVVLQPGAKVRVTAPTAGVQRFEGTVVAAGDTLDVARGNARIRVATSAVTQIELSRGRSRSAGAARGALWGAGIGAVLGAVTYTSYKDGCEDSLSIYDDVCDPITPGLYVASAALGGAFWGTIVGAIVGRERWDTVMMGGTRTSMAMTPWASRDGRFGVAVTLR